MFSKNTRSKLKIGDIAPDFEFDAPWQGGLHFYEAAGDKPAVLVFLRYLGCPVCRMEMADLRRDVQRSDSERARVFVVLQSAPSSVASAVDREEFPFTIACDPRGDLFALYRVAPGGLFKYLHPAGAAAAIGALFRGFRHGKFEGKETQLPAVFVAAPNREVRWAHYGKHISDLPSWPTVAAHID